MYLPMYYIGAVARSDFLHHISAGAGQDNFYLEAIPDAEVTDYSLRLCELRIHTIGDALPCVDGVKKFVSPTYSKSDEALRPFNDFADIYFSKFCPINEPDAKAEDNQFKAILIYELPPQEGIATGATTCMGTLQDVNVEFDFLLRCCEDQRWSEAGRLDHLGGLEGVQCSKYRLWHTSHRDGNCFW